MVMLTFPDEYVGHIPDCFTRDHSVHALSQWEMSFHCKVVSLAGCIHKMIPASLAQVQLCDRMYKTSNHQNLMDNHSLFQITSNLVHLADLNCNQIDGFMQDFSNSLTNSLKLPDSAKLTSPRSTTEKFLRCLSYSSLAPIHWNNRNKYPSSLSHPGLGWLCFQFVSAASASAAATTFASHV